MIVRCKPIETLDKTSFLSELYDLLRRHEDPNDDVTWDDIVDFYNGATGESVSKDTIRKGAFLLQKFSRENWLRPPGDETPEDVAQPPTATTTSLNADGTQSSELRAPVSQEDLHDPEYLLKLHGYDPARFELVSAKASQWGVSDSPLYSSKVVVRPIAETINQEDIEGWFDHLDRSYSLQTPHKLPEWGEGDKLLLIPLSDLHFNMQATMFNSGNEYDCDSAEKMFFHVIRDILDETTHYRFQRILFTIGGDQMDADSPANATTKGTPQNCDKHYWDACEQMYDMTVKAVDLLASRAPVTVIYVPGNHDKQTGYKLAKYVDAWFRNDERVTVDYSPLPRHYYVFGNTLFVFTHDADVRRLQKLIPDEARDVWGDVQYTEVFLQHLHSEALLFEENNMRAERLPTPVARSVWANEKGYRALRQCKSFVYDELYGRRAVIHTVIPM